MNDIDKKLLEYDNKIKKVAYWNKVNGYPQEDLEQDFRMILVKCVENFDASKNTSFDTYFISSCKNHVYSMRRKTLSKGRPDFVMSLDQDTPTGEPIMNLFEGNTLDPHQEWLQDSGEFLLAELDKLEFGWITKMHIIYNVSQIDIAEAEGLSPVFVNRRHAENIQTLREKLGL